MLDDFLIRALIAGIGLAIITGPLGSFIVWRKMAYFGETMSHSALLGVALAILLNTSVLASVFAIGVVIAFSLIILQTRNTISNDALLGILSHATLSIGLVIISFMTWVRVDLMGYLFGDILSVTTTDIYIIYLGGTAILAIMVLIWRSLLTATISPDLAHTEGLNPQRSNLIFTLLIAGVIAMAMKVIGIILVTSLLIIPAASARRFASTPEQMAVIASILGIISVIAGLWGSLTFDTPSGPSIVVAAFAVFLITIVPFSTKFLKPATNEKDTP